MDQKQNSSQPINRAQPPRTGVQQSKPFSVQQNMTAISTNKEIETIQTVTPEQQSKPEQSQTPEATIEKREEVIQQKEQSVTMKQATKPTVTHSGPGVIIEEKGIEQNKFGVKTLPVTYQEALKEEKQTQLRDSKHWLMKTIMYVWQKINPKL
jgi:hypothetical protein